MTAVYSDPVPLALSLVSFSAFSALLFRTCMQRVPAPKLYIPIACTALIAATSSYAVEAIVKYAAPNARKTFRASTPSGDESNLPPTSQHILAACHALSAVAVQLFWTSWMLTVRQQSVAVRLFLMVNALAHGTIVAVVAASTSFSTLLRPNAGSPPFSQVADFLALYRVVLLLVAFFVLTVVRGRRLASLALVALVFPVASDIAMPYLDRGSIPTLVVDAMAIASTIALVAVTVGIPKHGWNDNDSSADVAYLVKPTRTTVYRSSAGGGSNDQDPMTMPFARRSSLFEIGSQHAPRISIHPPTRHTTLDNPVARPLSTAVVTPSPPQTPRAVHPKQERSLSAVVTAPEAQHVYPETGTAHALGCPCPSCHVPDALAPVPAMAMGIPQHDQARRPSGSNLGVKFAGDRGSSEVGPLQVIAVESPSYSHLADPHAPPAAHVVAAPPPVLSALPRPPSFSPPETLKHQYQAQYPTLNLPAATPTNPSHLDAAVTYQQQQQQQQSGHHDGYDDAEVVVIMSDASGSDRDHDHEPLGLLPSLGSRRPSGGGTTTLSINSRTSSLSRPMSPTTAAVAARLTRHLSEVGTPASPTSTASFALLGASTVGVDPLVLPAESEVGNPSSEVDRRSRLSSMIDSQLMASEVTLADVGRLSAPGGRQPGPPTSESVRAVVSGWPVDADSSAGPSPSADTTQQAPRMSQYPRGSIAAISSTASSPTSAVTLFHSHSGMSHPPPPVAPDTSVAPMSIVSQQQQQQSQQQPRESLILPADALTVSVPVPPSSVISSTSSADRYVPILSDAAAAQQQPPAFETVASMYRNSLTRKGTGHVSRTLSINGRSPMSSLSRPSSEAGSSTTPVDPTRLPLPDSDASSVASPTGPPRRKSISSPPERLSINTSALPARGSKGDDDTPYTASSQHSSEQADDLILDPVALTRGSVVLAHSPRTSLMSTSSNDDASGLGGVRRPSTSSAGSVPMSSVSRTRTPSLGKTMGSPLGSGVPKTSSPLATTTARTLHDAGGPTSPVHDDGSEGENNNTNRASYMSGYQKFDTLTRGSMAWVNGVPSSSGVPSPASPVPPTYVPSDDDDDDDDQASASATWTADGAAVPQSRRGPTTHVYAGTPSAVMAIAGTAPEQRM